MKPVRAGTKGLYRLPLGGRNRAAGLTLGAGAGLGWPTLASAFDALPHWDWVPTHLLALAAVFPLLGGAKMTGERLFEPAEAGSIRYDVATAVAAVDKGLVISHPFGAFRLQAAAPR